MFSLENGPLSLNPIFYLDYLQSNVPSRSLSPDLGGVMNYHQGYAMKLAPSEKPPAPLTLAVRKPDPQTARN